MSDGIERRNPAEVEMSERAAHVNSLENLTSQVRMLRAALQRIADNETGTDLDRAGEDMQRIAREALS